MFDPIFVLFYHEHLGYNDWLVRGSHIVTVPFLKNVKVFHIISFTTQICWQEFCFFKQCLELVSTRQDNSSIVLQDCDKQSCCIQQAAATLFSNNIIIIYFLTGSKSRLIRTFAVWMKLQPA